MTFAAALSLLAACLELVVGALCLGFARAPGWERLRLRLFAFVAFTAAAYSLTSVPQTLEVAPRWIVPASRLSLAAGALQTLGWLLYSAGHGGQPPRTSWPERALRAVLVALAALALVPGALARPAVRATVLPSLGLRYQTAEPTALGEAAFVVLLASLLVPVWRYARGVRRGTPGSWPHLAGMATLLACSAVEAGVAAGLLQLPYLLDLGFLAATLTIGSELVRQAVGDARTLQAMNQRLEREVARRTAELTRAQEALAQTERMAALGRLAAGVAHRVNSPLAAISANTAWVQRELEVEGERGGAAEVRQAVGEIGEAARRIHGVVMDLRVFALRPRGDPGTTAVRPVIDSAIRLVGPALSQPGAVLIEDGDPPPVGAVGAQLAQVLVSLLEHALRPGPSGVSLPISVRTRAEGGQVLVEVEDRGPAPPPGHRAAELSLAAGLLRDLDGRLEIESRPEGTLARAWLPQAGFPSVAAR